MFKKKILVIDDSHLMVRMITDILETAGYDVAAASNGLEGIELVRTEKPDLVLLDVVMPGMDGFEVCKQLRADDSNNLMPIIILTTQKNDDNKLLGLELGADDYITKPFNHRELLSRVKNTLRRIGKNRWANPLTGLQGNNEIQAEVTLRIARKKQFAVLYLDMDNFKAYNDVYGFAMGDTAITMTADIISDNVRQYGCDDDFIGHIGGDDFVIVTMPKYAHEIGNGIIKNFDKKVKTLYREGDRKKGYIETRDRQGNKIKYPIMSLSVAIVSNEKKQLKSVLEVSELAAELKKKAKSAKGSVCIEDKRTQ